MAREGSGPQPVREPLRGVLREAVETQDQRLPRDMQGVRSDELADRPRFRVQAHAGAVLAETLSFSFVIAVVVVFVVVVVIAVVGGAFLLYMLVVLLLFLSALFLFCCCQSFFYFKSVFQRKLSSS